MPNQNTKCYFSAILRGISCHQLSTWTVCRIVSHFPSQTLTFQVIFFFRLNYFEQWLPRLSGETKRNIIHGKMFNSNGIFSNKLQFSSDIHLPAISPFNSSFRFSAAVNFASVSLVCCWNFSASVLAAARFSFSDEIWMLSLASVCSLLFLSSSSSCVSFAWKCSVLRMRRRLEKLLRSSNDGELLKLRLNSIDV